MSLIRYSTSAFPGWSAYNRLASLQQEVNRLFDHGSTSRESGLLSGWSPALDLYDAKENFVVHVELPGMKKEDLEISLHDGVLTIAGERVHEAKQNSEEGAGFRSERSFGKFQRSVNLPVAVDASKVQAVFKDGVLTITLPKAEESKPRRIQIGLS